MRSRGSPPAAERGGNAIGAPASAAIRRSYVRYRRWRSSCATSKYCTSANSSATDAASPGANGYASAAASARVSPSASPRRRDDASAATTKRAVGRACGAKRRKSASASSSRCRSSRLPRASHQIASSAGASSRARCRGSTARLHCRNRCRHSARFAYACTWSGARAMASSKADAAFATSPCREQQLPARFPRQRPCRRLVGRSGERGQRRLAFARLRMAHACVVRVHGSARGRGHHAVAGGTACR